MLSSRCLKLAVGGDSRAVTFGLRAIAESAPCTSVSPTFDDGRLIERDHVLFRTGFRQDLRFVSLLAVEIRGAVYERDGKPILGARLRDLLGGLHVICALASDRLDPVMRFVSGTWYAAPAVAAHVAGRLLPRPRRFSTGRTPATITALDAA